ncbi:jg13578 [Pararge aegeria aegeria]|uniref:Jg13578 protein n=5 Tax=Pararge aegeria TaxID=116150 RepID=A0A8S4QUZ6_9NEOP|nr:jg13578 [Pararge aegeria aegeria]
MEENSKRRTRKSKLVPRDCMDSDDENIAVMQQEIEAALAHMKNKSILKKLSRQQSSPKPLQFSVKVEMEEVDEPQETEQNLNIKIDSVKSLSEPTAVPRSSKEPEVLYFRISEDVIRKEFEKVSRETTSVADKRIELNVRNILGKKRTKEGTRVAYVEIKLQNIFRRTWKNWCNTFPTIRETPLLYKCYTCKKAWWHLHDFREHIMQHEKLMTILLQTISHECHVLAHEGNLITHAGLTDLNDKRYSVDSNCWRCGKEITMHIMSNLDKSTEYRCSGCKEKFYTCTLLCDHENSCSLYKRVTGKNPLNEIHACTQCSAKLTSEKLLLEHMVQRHSVRSDLPEDWVLKICSHCDYPFHLQALHDCPLKPPVASCKFCFQKFNSHTFLLIHLNSTQHLYPCKVCGLVLRKQCMELQHLMEHTDKYTTLYKCIYCKDDIYFPTLFSINKHKQNAHVGFFESKSLGTCYDVVVVPKTLAAIQPGMKHIEREKELESLDMTKKTSERAYGGLLGTLGKPSGSSTNHHTNECADKNTNETKIKFFKNVGRPAKTYKVEEKSHFKQENDIIYITDSPQEDEDLDVRILDDSNQSVVIDISTPDDYLDNIINNIKAEPSNYTDDHINESIQKNVSDDIDEHENTTEISNGNISDIRQTEINHFDPCLVIKEEKLDYNETDNAQQEPNEMPNIKIENVMRIKEEDMDIVQENDKVVDGDCSIISGTNKKTPISLTEINKLRFNSKINLKTNLKKLRANINNKLRTNFDKLKANDKKDKSNTNKDTLAPRNNEKGKLKTDNGTLSSSFDNINNEEGNKTDELDVRIKEEPDLKNFYTNFDVNAEELAYEIKEENLDELLEDDMIILDPNNSVSMNYEMEPGTKASVASGDVESQGVEPELVVYHSNQRKLYKCTKCSFQGHHFAFKLHQKKEKHAPNKKACLRKSKGDDCSARYTCTKCNITYVTWYKYIVHFSKVHAYKSQTCPKCFRPYMTLQALQGHLNAHIKESYVSVYVITTKDPEPEQFTQQCKICSEKVATADQFKHWEGHLDILDVTKKTQPWKGFSNSMEHKHELKMMLLLLQGINLSPDSNEKMFNKLKYCLKCKRRFERKNECKRHFIEHLLIDAYQERHKHGFLKCQICSANFYTSERYKRHMREHGSLPLYKCELCDKTFSDSSNFTKHKKVHNLSVLICDICNKKFTGKPFLEKHILMHQNVDPFVCQECNKVFYTESSYRKHISRGKTRFKCPSCHIFFATLREKWDHMWEVHKERKFQADCPICNKSFRKHQDVRTHMRIEHKDSPYKYVPDKTPLTDVKHKAIENEEDLVVVYIDDE